jgi:hypothetical protein
MTRALLTICLVLVFSTAGEAQVRGKPKSGFFSQMKSMAANSGPIYGGPPYGPRYDRPFPLGQVTDAFWETQQTNAEAADFIFHDHEFIGNTAVLAPGAKRHLESVALRLEHVPFPVVIERSPYNARPELDKARRTTIVEQLNRMGVTTVDERVIIAVAFPHGYSSIEAESAYFQTLGLGGGGGGRRFGGGGGLYR